MAAKILFVDDLWKEEGWKEKLQRWLPETLEVIFEDRGDKTLQQLQTHPEIKLVLLDLNFEGQTKHGVQIFEEITEHYPALPVFILSTLSDAEVVYQLLRAAKRPICFFKENLDRTPFVGAIEKAVENYDEKTDAIRNTNKGSIVGESRAIKEVLRQVTRLNQRESAVLITGETGTGKELIARAIHQNSPRRGKPFVPINCATIPSGVAESELFGHVKGAFADAIRDRRGAFEVANGGTLFLDEIGELPLELQSKLLRALREGEIRRVGAEKEIQVQVRVIAATHRDLEQGVQEKWFREDLYYRLNVIRIHLPPLRERTEDIPALVQYILVNNLAARKEVTDEALAFLQGYPWPGNIGELANILERAVVNTEDEVLTRDVFAPFLSPTKTTEQNVVREWVNKVFAGGAGWQAIIGEYSSSGETCRAILDGIIRESMSRHQQVPSVKDLATLLKERPGNVSQALLKAGLKLRGYK